MMLFRQCWLRTSAPLRGLTIVLALGLSFGSYFVLRYGGTWSEQDTQVFVGVATRQMQANGISFAGNYDHGYGYPTWLASISHVTGASPAFLSQSVLPIAAGLLFACLGLAAFRRLTGSDRLGVMATLVLFLAPELVFTMIRGNHEKLTAGLTILALLAMFMSFAELAKGRDGWRTFAGWLAVYYVIAFTTASMNAFFGSSLIIGLSLALALALTMALVIPSLRYNISPIAYRLILVSTTSWALVVLVMFFVFPSAGNILRVMESGGERIAALALTLTPETDPYARTQTDWASPMVYAWISSFKWVLLVTSLVTWFVYLGRLISSARTMPLNQLFMVALYGGLALQVGIAIAVDMTGLGLGSNLQVRLFSYFALVASPVAAMGAQGAIARLPRRPRRFITRILPPVMAAFMMASILKATLDPSVSNRWLFYRNNETRAVHFWDRRHEASRLWIGNEPRIRHAFNVEHPDGVRQGNSLEVRKSGPVLRFALGTEVLRANLAAWHEPALDVLAENRAYDNGEAQIFHRIARTPYQR